MPTPCPHPRPVNTTPPAPLASVYQRDGIVAGSADPYRLSVGYRAGIRHGPHAFTAASKSDTEILRLVSPPDTTIDPPDGAADEIGVPAGQRLSARRNRARSANGIGTRQGDSG